MSFDSIFRRAFASLDKVAFPLIFALMVLLHYLVFLVVPSEKEMGAVQRIFYFHVGSAFACYCSVACVLVGSLCYLGFRNGVYDVLSEAAAEVGFVFCSIVLFTGMIWGSVIWNTPFHWEPRLVSFLLLWFIFVALVALRLFGDEERVALHCAVLGVVAAVTVPIVIFSIQLLPQVAQLHPQVVSRGGLKEPIFRYTFFLAVITLVCLQLYLIAIRARIGMIERRNAVRV